VFLFNLAAVTLTTVFKRVKRYRTKIIWTNTSTIDSRAKYYDPTFKANVVAISENSNLGSQCLQKCRKT